MTENNQNNHAYMVLCNAIEAIDAAKASLLLARSSMVLTREMMDQPDPALQVGAAPVNTDKAAENTRWFSLVTPSGQNIQSSQPAFNADELAELANRIMEKKSKPKRKQNKKPNLSPEERERRSRWAKTLSEAMSQVRAKKQAAAAA